MHARELVLSIAMLASSASLAAADPPVEEDILEVTERIDRAPSDVVALLQRSELYAREGAIEEALADVRVADAVAPGDARVITQRAAILHRLGRDDEALAEVDAALSRSTSFDALVLRARVRVALGQLERGIDDYDAALALDDSVDIHLERGRLLVRLDRIDDALRGYEEGLLATSAIVLREAAIELCLRRGDGARALSHADAVLRSMPAPRWRLLRARALDALGRRDDARLARLEALAEIDRRLRRRASAALHVERGEALLSLERLDEALGEARLARALAPSFERARTLESDVRRATDAIDAAQVDRGAR